MREILFRGKIRETGTWVEGWYCGQTCKTFFGEPVNCAQIIVKDDLGWAEVIPETVGQFTGLKDKNGRKIFEGDIIQFPKFPFMDDGPVAERRVSIVWGDGGWDCMHPAWTGWSNDAIDDDTANETKVIGNIYDNPELMEVPHESD